MRAFVTGGSGFVGGRLLAALRAGGHEVRALARPGRVPAAAERRITWLAGVVTDGVSLRAAARGCDVAFHCAHGGDDAAAAHRINVGGARNVLESASTAGIRRVVHLSTWRVHGRNLPPRAHEELPLVERGLPYDVSKAEAERTAAAFAGRLGIELVVLRPTLVYGPGSQPWVNDLVERLKYERLLLIDGGVHTANVVYVDDLVQAMLHAATVREAAGQAFLVSGDPVPWRDYLGRLCGLLGRQVPPSVPGWAARGAAAAELWRLRLTRRPPRVLRGDVALFGERCTADTDKARRVLGWRPTVALARGMAAVGERLRAEGRIGAGLDDGPAAGAFAGPRWVRWEA